MSWSTTGGVGAQAVAKAFYEGRKLKRGNCRTDGSTYWLFDHAIARRIPDDQLAAAVIDKIQNGGNRARLEFSMAGYVNNTTIAHLDALGVRVSRKSYKPYVNGCRINPSAWYTPEELAALKPEPRKPRFVNLTAELFEA